MHFPWSGEHGSKTPVRSNKACIVHLPKWYSQSYTIACIVIISFTFHAGYPIHDKAKLPCQTFNKAPQNCSPEPILSPSIFGVWWKAIIFAQWMMHGGKELLSNLNCRLVGKSPQQYPKNTFLTYFFGILTMSRKNNWCSHCKIWSETVSLWPSLSASVEVLPIGVGDVTPSK